MKICSKAQSLGKYDFKTTNIYYYIPTRIKNFKSQMLVKIRINWNAYTLLEGTGNGTSA